MEISSDLYNKKTLFSLTGASGIVVLLCSVLFYFFPAAKELRVVPLIFSGFISFIGYRFLKERREEHIWLAFLNSFLIFSQALGFNTLITIQEPQHLKTRTGTSVESPTSMNGSGVINYADRKFFSNWYN